MENTPEKKKKTLTGIRPIRTYQDDIAQAVNKQQEDLISIRTKEQERKNREGFVTQPIKKESSGNSLLFIALFLIVLGLIVIGALWWTSRPQIEETQKARKLFYIEIGKGLLLVIAVSGFLYWLLQYY